MTEVKKIQTELARNGRVAYNRAKSNNNAYIVRGNAIYRIYSDGRKELVQTIPSIKVKAISKKIVFE
jgi:hypothetical protein